MLRHTIQRKARNYFSRSAGDFPRLLFCQADKLARVLNASICDIVTQCNVLYRELDRRTTVKNTLEHARIIYG